MAEIRQRDGAAVCGQQKMIELEMPKAGPGHQGAGSSSLRSIASTSTVVTDGASVTPVNCLHCQHRQSLQSIASPSSIVTHAVGQLVARVRRYIGWNPERTKDEVLPISCTDAGSIAVVDGRSLPR